MGVVAGNEHDSSQDAREGGEQSGSMDVGMGVITGKEHENGQDEGTPESSPIEELPSPTDNKTIHSGEKRKNPTREAKAKNKLELPPPLPRPRPKPKPRPRLKPKSRAQPIDLVECNYFEEIEFGGVSRIVDMVDLMQDIVGRSLPYKGTIC
jgi:hypothetical protein